MNVFIGEGSKHNFVWKEGLVGILGWGVGGITCPSEGNSSDSNWYPGYLTPYNELIISKDDIPWPN